MTDNTELATLKDENTTLRDNVTTSIENILNERKLNYIADTEEFIEGLLIGLEIAGIYGTDIQTTYSEFISRRNSE